MKVVLEGSDREYEIEKIEVKRMEGFGTRDPVYGIMKNGEKIQLGAVNTYPYEYKYGVKWNGCVSIIDNDGMSVSWVKAIQEQEGYLKDYTPVRESMLSIAMMLGILFYIFTSVIKY